MVYLNIRSIYIRLYYLIHSVVTLDVTESEAYGGVEPTP